MPTKRISAVGTHVQTAGRAARHVTAKSHVADRVTIRRRRTGDRTAKAIRRLKRRDGITPSDPLSIRELLRPSTSAYYTVEANATTEAFETPADGSGASPAQNR